MSKHLAPIDSPLAEAVLELKTCKLLQEDIRDRSISIADLARKLGLHASLLEAAIHGQSALKIGIWKALSASLKVQPEYYNFRPSERHGGDCWEIYNVLVVT